MAGAFFKMSRSRITRYSSASNDCTANSLIPLASTETIADNSGTKQSSYLWAFCYSLLMTALVGVIVNPTRMHEWMLLRDQGMYITAARQFLETGRMESSHRPVESYAENKRNFNYMPGYPLVLAGVYAIFGFGVLQSVLPTALLFILSCMLCYHIGLKLYSSFTGWVAMLIFSCYPFIHLLTFIAMADIPIVTSLLLSLAIFLKLSHRWQMLIGWTLPVMAFLFRETSAVVIFPMCAVMRSRSQNPDRWKAVICFFFVSLTAITAIYLSPINPRDGFFYRLIVYKDDPELVETQPFGTPQKPRIDVFIQNLLELSGRNILQLIQNLKLSIRGLEWIFIVLVIPLGLWHFLRYKDYFMLSIAVATVILLIALVTLFNLGHIGKRHMLALIPLASIVYAQTAALWIPVRWHRYSLALLLVVIVPVSLIFVYRDWRQLHSFDEHQDVMLHELENAHHVDTTVMMGTYEATVGYFIERYPVKILSLAYNKARLQTALESNNITTIVIPSSNDVTFNKMLTKLTNDDLEALGFRWVRTIHAMEQTYQIYQRK